MSKKIIMSIIFSSLAGLVLLFLLIYKFLPVNNITEPQVSISNFKECVDAGNPVMESYPRQCRANNQTFVEDVTLPEEPLIGGDTDEGGCLIGAGYSWCEIKQKCLRVWEEPCEEGTHTSLIRVSSPAENQEITSPLTIEGEAVGNWFFEASFPVVLVNWDGLIIAQGIATAQSDWMTTDFVPFEAVLEFEADTQVSNRGALILKKDNPSGLPQYDDALEIPVLFK